MNTMSGALEGNQPELSSAGIKDAIKDPLGTLGSVAPDVLGKIPGVSNVLDVLGLGKKEDGSSTTTSTESLRLLAEELGRIAREAAWNEQDRRGWY